MQDTYLGWKFETNTQTKETIRSPVTPEKTESSIDVAALDAFGTPIGHYVDLENSTNSENTLVEKYREISMIPEVDKAIEEITSDAIISDQQKSSVTLNLDNVDLPDNIKKKINDEFDSVLRLLKFKNKGYDIFRRWYIDGRINYHCLYDEEKPHDGIQELRYIDPKKIKKVREIKFKDPQLGIVSNKDIREFYIYNEHGVDNMSAHMGEMATRGVKITKDAIAHANSGLMDHRNSIVLSFLHKALRVANNLRMMEDSLVIYRVSRAPERRIFYIDVGNLPRGKGEQYMTEIMNKYKNKIVYDVNTGQIKDDRRHLAMTEDYWIPRREGTRGTEIDTLPGGDNLGETGDLDVFYNKLYMSLNVPRSRFTEESSMFGRGTEVTREELKFSRYVTRLRNRFSFLFDEILGKQVVLKRIMSLEEWQDIVDEVHYDFLQDNHFTELFYSEILAQRFNLLRDANDYVGKYFSKEYVQKNILQFSDEEIKEEDKKIKEENASGDGGDDDDKKF